MNGSAWTRYGWVFVLLALGALWLRVENQGMHRVAIAAPAPANGNNVLLPPATVAVLDIAIVYQNYRDFLEELDRIKREIAEFDVEVKRVTQELKELGEEMKLHEPGGEVYTRLLAVYQAKSTDMRERIDLKKKDFLKAESALYYDSHQKVEAVVGAVARKRKANLVLRFSSESMNREDRASVLQGMNRSIVYHASELDITKDVLAVLNQP